MRTTGNKEIFVGIGVITGFLLLMAYFYGGKSMAAQATEGYRLTAAFNKVDGLFPAMRSVWGGLKSVS